VSRDLERDRALLAMLVEGGPLADCDSIIVYCTRRNECERLANMIRTHLQARLRWWIRILTIYIGNKQNLEKTGFGCKLKVKACPPKNLYCISKRTSLLKTVIEIGMRLIFLLFFLLAEAS
jgi:hypothetical protein